MGHWLTIWFEKWQQLLADYSVRLWVFAALYVMFAMVEVLFPAERHQGLVGRMRNLIFAALYVLVGLAVVSVVVLAVRPPMPVLPNRGPLVSAWYCFLYYP